LTTHAVFWIVGMLFGWALVAMIGKSFVEDRGPRLIPLFIGIALIFGLVMGWALSSWIDYIGFTAKGGGGF
jgi:hypothetical protein